MIHKKQIKTTLDNVLIIEAGDFELEVKVYADFSHLLTCEDANCEVSFTARYSDESKFNEMINDDCPEKAQRLYDGLKKEFEDINSGNLKGVEVIKLTGHLHPRCNGCGKPVENALELDSILGLCSSCMFSGRKST